LPSRYSSDAPPLAAYANAIDFGGAPNKLQHYMIGLAR
jgi:hypothetical protein